MRNAEVKPLHTSDKVAIMRMINVMHAVALRDIRSRYFNHGLGFLMGPMMPVAHMLILLLLYTFTGRDVVFGEDLALFFATGLVPALTFTYISRYMSISVVANKSMLAFPAVKLLDIMLARSFLEIVSIVLAMFFIGTILVATGSSIVPRSPEQALLAMACTTALAIGVGIIASVIAAIFPFFAMIYSLFMVVVYLSSNAPIYLNAFPEQVIYYCSFNPVFHVVEWMRSAYYLGYPAQYLDKTYVLMWCILCPPVGLLLERLLRPQIMS